MADQKAPLKMVRDTQEWLRNTTPGRFYICCAVRGHSMNHICLGGKFKIGESLPRGVVEYHDNQCHKSYNTEKSSGKPPRDRLRLWLMRKVCCNETNLSKHWQFFGATDWKHGKMMRVLSSSAFGTHAIFNFGIGLWGTEMDFIKLVEGADGWNTVCELLIFVYLMCHGAMNAMHAVDAAMPRCRGVYENAKKPNKDMTQFTNKEKKIKMYAMALAFSSHHNALCAPISALMTICKIAYYAGTEHYDDAGIRVRFDAWPMYISLAIFIVMAWLHFFFLAQWSYFGHAKAYDGIAGQCPQGNKKGKKKGGEGPELVSREDPDGRNRDSFANISRDDYAPTLDF